MKTCPFPKAITKQASQRLRMELRNTELYLTRTTFCSWFAARLPELACKLDCSKLLPPVFRVYIQKMKYQSKLPTDHLSGELDAKLLRFTSLRWPQIASKQTSVATLGISACLSIFTNIKLLIIDRRNSIGVIVFTS